MKAVKRVEKAIGPIEFYTSFIVFLNMVSFIPLFFGLVLSYVLFSSALIAKRLERFHVQLLSLTSGLFLSFIFLELF
ncbi:MAG: hypothetical protein HY393_04420 [Candidatus Diapherotrites archaeon]|nr:hypothetical protein [Candidatus Diapherotrites archaeon]